MDDRDRRAIKFLKQMGETAERALEWRKKAFSERYYFSQLIGDRSLKAIRLLKDGDAKEARMVLEGYRDNDLEIPE